MSITCQYCGKKLQNGDNLVLHHKSNKLCQKKRGILPENEKYKCLYCDREFARNYTLDRHIKICPKKKVRDTADKYESSLQKYKGRGRELRIKIRDQKDDYDEKLKHEKEKNKKLQKENNSLKDKISELEGVITGLKTAPDKRTIYNTNTAYVHPKLVNLPISNIPALTDEFVQQKADDGILTYKKASKGYSGMLEIISELITYENDDGIVERSYVCTDVSRNSFHRLLESKKWKSDKGGRYLNNMLETFRDVIEGHKDKVYDLYKNTPHDSIEWENVEWTRKNISRLYSGIVCKEGTEDREELVNILRKEISKRASV